MTAVDASNSSRSHIGRRPGAGRGAHVVGVLALLAGSAAVQVAVARPAAAAPLASTLTITVEDAETHTAIPNFKYLVNLDNTGQTTQRSTADHCSPTDANYANPDPTLESCKWTSMGVASSSPVVAQGDQADFAGGAKISIPNDRYLVSVIADGYKLDGTHFTLAVDNSTVKVEMNKDPLPTATIQAAVFEDISPTNGAPDVPAERGLAGFRAILRDTLGQVTTDVFGNPMCTTYQRDAAGNPVLDAGGSPIVVAIGGNCYSQCYAAGDVVVSPVAGDPQQRCPAGTQGKVIIPNMGTNRFTLSLAAPDGQGWVQTTTLEGNHDWDAWVMEAATGLDTEFVQGGEPFPGVIFGYLRPTNTLAAGPTGSINGVVEAMKVYYPPKGGTGQPGQIFGGLQGARADHPIDRPYLSLSNLGGGDTVVWMGRGNTDGTFTIPNVPDGSYQLTWWDEPQNYILDWRQVDVVGGLPVDLGIVPLNGWWTTYEGTVFSDLNRNGKQDPGENGLPNYTLTVRTRDNSLMDRGGNFVTTDAQGHYKIENAYPMTQYYVIEAYNDRFYTTGITYQADNQATETTVPAERDANGLFLSTGVDVSTLPIIGLGGRLDWGVHAYDAVGATVPPGETHGVDPRNGGIVGTVSYDTTRNELDPRYAAVEDWQPGVSGLTVGLYDTVPCGTSTTCDATGRYQLDPNDGSFLKGKKLNTYVTETWQQPVNCTARDIDGNPLAYPADQKVLPIANTTGNPLNDKKCLEGPLSGVQFDTTFAAVDGNYGFSEECLNGTIDATDPANPVCNGGTFSVLRGSHDYLVKPENLQDALGRDVYKVTAEEDINIGNGSAIVPQIPPPACAGALHQVDVAGAGTDGYAATTVATAGGGSVQVAASTPIDNPTFLDIGGSPYEGMARPRCDTKLVTVSNGRSIVPTFNYFTDVPLPGRFWGLVVDDLNFSADPTSLLYGEKAGVPFAPVGIYDYKNRLVHTTESDFNGLFDVLMPSTNQISCPTPSGVCTNVYRFVGNDPGTPGKLNANFKPQFRTIAAEFESMPGVLVPADLAPTQVGVSVQLPGGQTNLVACAQESTTPQLFTLDKVTAVANGPAAQRTVTITGAGFGGSRTGTAAVLLDGNPINGGYATWTDTSITVLLDGVNAGPHQITVRASNGRTTVNGITFHMRETGQYNPAVLEVGPGRTYAPQSVAARNLAGTAEDAIQQAIDAANPGDLIVIYPGLVEANPRNNPRQAYFENLIVNKPVKLQGVGPGGTYANGTSVPGTVIDGSSFGGDSPMAAYWLTHLATPAYNTWVGNQNINDGAVVTVFARTATTFPLAPTAAQRTMIDGIDLRGGDQQGFPGNINAIGGVPTGLPAGIVTQGGAVFANAYVRGLQLSNNVVENNGGGYGTIRFGTPDLPDPSSHNENARILNNRIIHNAGTNVAGALGLFEGSDGYEVARNDFCGNFSAEYGGAMSVYGLSPNGRIHDNRIYFNASYDEGGGVMIAGNLPADPAAASRGAGTTDIYNNLVQANLGNDDGGGIRFLQAGTAPMNVYNNILANNVSTHEGGGIAINDTTDVRFFNNTVMKNMTTATAVTSNGQPAPAGLSTSRLSTVLGGGATNVTMFNDVFWDNRAGTRAGATVTGLGLAGTADVNQWDIGAPDLSTPLLAPTNSVIQTATKGIAPSATNSAADPAVVAPYDTSVGLNVWRGNPAYVGALLVSLQTTPTLMGNYHLSGTTSPANNLGAASKLDTVAGANVAAPAFDIDNGGRPAGGGYDAGADENPGAVAGGSVDLNVTKTDGFTLVAANQTVRYTIRVGKATTGAVANVSVADTLPSALVNVSWTCTSAGAGSSCGAPSGSGSLTTTVSLGTGTTTATGGPSATFAVTGTIAPAATGTVMNAVTVQPPAGTNDPVPGNNIAVDVDTVVAAPLPALGLLDTFDRANANTLGANWSQVTLLGAAAIRVNANQASAPLPGSAVWNGAGSAFGARQGAAFTFVGAATNAALVLKASGGTATAPTNFIRVQVQTGTNTVVVATTTNGNQLLPTYTTQGTLLASIAAGSTLTAWADAGNNVYVYNGSTLLGIVSIPATGTGSWAPAAGAARIGIQLPLGARIDNFNGGAVA